VLGIPGEPGVEHRPCVEAAVGNDCDERFECGNIARRIFGEDREVGRLTRSEASACGVNCSERGG